MEVTQVDYLGWKNCYRISNKLIELIIPTAFGIRIIHFGFRGKENQFGVFPPNKNQNEAWNIYGGHRLWQSPEIFPTTYSLDNRPVEFKRHSDWVRVVQPIEENASIQKEIDIFLDGELAQVQVVHRLTNRSDNPITLAPWGLSVMASGGKGIIPLISKDVNHDGLLPVGTISLWPYTDMSYLGWQWMHKYVAFQHNPNQSKPQKIGVTCSDGWIAYYNNNVLFLKKFSHQPNMDYPDGGCAAEMYAKDQFMEIETLGPLSTLSPGGSVEHEEIWYLFDEVAEPKDEKDIDKFLLPLIFSVGEGH